ncbi:MAG: anthranilate synthase component II [Candidatus Limnocylindria bacterium]
MKVFLLDNYDSFTYNLVHLLSGLGTDVTVARNDQVTVDEVAAAAPDAVVISPGPSRPERAGISVELVRRLGTTTPTLGVCLGHQAIGVAYGARVVRVEPVHGKRSPICHDGAGPFAGLRNPLPAARYHSLAVDRASLPLDLRVTAWAPDGTVMAMAHRSHPVVGLQFHPESILTDDGAALVGAFLAGSGRSP